MEALIYIIAQLILTAVILNMDNGFGRGGK